MKWLINGFNAKNHSWSCCNQAIARQLLAMGHDVDIFSTNGITNFPIDLKPHLIGYHEEPTKGTDKMPEIYGKYPKSGYDAAFAFTSMKNFESHLCHANKNRFGLWAQEVYSSSTGSLLPDGWAKCVKHTNMFFVPSTTNKQAMVDSLVPDSRVSVLPLGFRNEYLSNTDVFKVNTQKRFKILVNLGQIHYRKNLPAIFEAFGKAFNRKDDVALVMKVNIKPLKFPFDVDFYAELDNFKRRFPQHAEVVIINHYIEDMSSLYRSCNALLTLSKGEGFLMPALETLAAKKLLICPDFGAHIDFCNIDNSLHVQARLVKADPRMYYWDTKIGRGLMTEVNAQHAAIQLKRAYESEASLLSKFDSEFEFIRSRYTWKNIVDKLLTYCT